MVEEYKGQDSGLQSNEKDENAKNISESKETSGTQESEGKSADENIHANTIDTDGVSNTSLPSSACAEMTHKCPFQVAAIWNWQMKMSTLIICGMFTNLAVISEIVFVFV